MEDWQSQFQQQALNRYLNEASKLSQLFESIPVSMLIVDHEARIKAVNEMLLANLQQLSREDIIGKSYRVVTDLLGFDYEQTTVSQALKTGKPQKRYIHSDGRDWLIHAIPHRDAATGKLTGAMAIYNEITDHERLREASYKKERDLLLKLNQIIEMLPLPLLEVDKDGIIRNVNQAFFKFEFAGLAKNDAVGKHYREFLSLTEEQYAETQIYQALKGIGSDQVYQLSGNHEWLINTQPLRDSESGEITGALAVYQNITQYEKMRRELARVDRMNLVSELAAGVAHEIRNPMTVIKGYLQFLGKSNSHLEEHFTLITGELDRINSIITDFLALTRESVSEKADTNLNDIVKNLYPLVYSNAMEHGVYAEIDLDTDLPPIPLNDKEIRQLLLNLSRNAIEAMSANGTLTIKTAVQNNKVHLMVSDTGYGIPVTNLGKIFDPFFTTKDEGTGLGLAICWSIVQRHSGAIHVQSEEGCGTTFTITFNTK